MPALPPLLPSQEGHLVITLLETFWTGIGRDEMAAREVLLLWWYLANFVLERILQGHLARRSSAEILSEVTDGAPWQSSTG